MYILRSLPHNDTKATQFTLYYIHTYVILYMQFKLVQTFFLHTCTSPTAPTVHLLPQFLRTCTTMSFHFFFTPTMVLINTIQPYHQIQRLYRTNYLLHILYRRLRSFLLTSYLVFCQLSLSPKKVRKTIFVTSADKNI